MGLTTGQLIDEVSEIQNAGSEQVDDTASRLRILHSAQLVCDAAWHVRPMDRAFTYGTVALTLAGDGFGLVPSDFANTGPKCRVYISGQRRELTYLEPGELFDQRERWTDTTQYPDFYTFAGLSTGVSGTTRGGLRKIVVSRRPSGNLTLVIENYVQKAPVLIDRPATKCVAADSLAAGNPDGALRYKVAFGTAYDYTETGPASVSVTVATNKVQLTSIPTSPIPTVTKRRIYRTVAGGEAYFLLATISDNTTTTYLDDVADGDLGAEEPTTAEVSTGMEMFPEDFHRQAILTAVRELTARNEGDGRSAGELLASATKGLAQMWAEEKVAHVRKRAPAYGARSW